jgi:hypothetical protein
MTAQILTNIPASRYHADELADQPTLSSSVAKLLVEASPAHARAAHPKLNPNFAATAEDRFDMGTCVHALLLQGEQVFDRLAFSDWRTNAAKEARDEARSHGRIPLLAKDADRVDEMVAAVCEQLAQLEVEPLPFTDGLPEQTLVWEEQGVLCRARLDWLRTDCQVCDDLKTTTRYANPEAWQRGPLYDHGADLQAAMYLRGLRAVAGVDAKWRWVVVETQPPYALSVIAPTAAVLAIGDAKFDMALAKWRRCLETGVWPAYPRTVVEAELPAWIESRWLEREAREEIAA